MLPAALATEDPTPDLLEVPPNGKHDWIINGCMLKHIFWQVLLGLPGCHRGQGCSCHAVQSCLTVSKHHQQAPPDCCTVQAPRRPLVLTKLFPWHGSPAITSKLPCPCSCKAATQICACPC